MPKKYAVAPILRDGKTSYSATFYNDAGDRVTRGLGTSDLSTARIICEGLVGLRKAKLEGRKGVPKETAAESVKLFYTGGTKGCPQEVSASWSELLNLAAVRGHAERYCASCREQAALDGIEAYRLRRENEAALAQVAALRKQLTETKGEYEAFKRSALGRVTQASRDIPNRETALKQFLAHLATKTTTGNVKATESVAKRFYAWLDKHAEGIDTLADVQPNHLNLFLDAETARTKPDKPLARRRNLHIRLARLINWAAESHQYPSQMLAVDMPKKKARRRERGAIHWHTKEEVERVIKSIADPYYKAMVGTLAYSGLRLSELVWLQTDHVVLDGAKPRIKVDPVDGHPLKTDNSQREVLIHKDLIPLLRDYASKRLTGKKHFFPKRGRDRKRQKANGETERWIVGALSKVLNGYEATKNKPARKGILPDGMSALSLRRTFGSLALRAGKTLSQVAAMMGNSEAVCSEHYAKLLGREVDVDF